FLVSGGRLRRRIGGGRDLDGRLDTLAQGRSGRGVSGRGQQCLDGRRTRLPVNLDVEVEVEQFDGLDGGRQAGGGRLGEAAGLRRRREVERVARRQRERIDAERVHGRLLCI